MAEKHHHTIVAAISMFTVTNHQKNNLCMTTSTLCLVSVHLHILYINFGKLKQNKRTHFMT